MSLAARHAPLNARGPFSFDHQMHCDEPAPTPRVGLFLVDLVNWCGFC